ncbi:MAG: HIT family protein, partial [Nanoarchaeota archaeon]
PQLQYLVGVVQKLSSAVKKGAKADGFIISMNNGRDAGQEIDHAHFHILPRFKGDGLVPWKEGQYKEGEMIKYADQIKKVL